MFGQFFRFLSRGSVLWLGRQGPSDLIEVNRSDDLRERYLSEEELRRLMEALDERMYRKGTKGLNQTNLRMRLIMLIAVSTGMRSAEMHRLRWSDVRFLHLAMVFGLTP